MDYDELIIHGYKNSSGHYQITVSHDDLVPEGGAIESVPIMPQAVADLRAKYDLMIKRSREVMQRQQTSAANHNPHLWNIAHELQTYPLGETEHDLDAIRQLCERFLAQWHGPPATLPLPINYEKMLEIGRKMYSIFPGTSLDLLRRSLEHTHAVTPRRGLRVIVEVDTNAQMLLDLPWEMLIIEEDTTTNSGNFLFFEQDVVLMRQIRNIGVARPIRLVAPVTPQVFVAQPPQGTPINAQLFANELMPLLQDQPIDAWWSTDPDMLRVMRERLARYNPQVVQLVCHGRRSPERSDMLLTYVDVDKTRIHRVSSQDLLQVLRGAPRLQVVLLTVCDSGRADQRDQVISQEAQDGQRPILISNIAYELVRGGIPLVIAMQEKIAQDAAAHFSHVLYEQLQHGLPIERALAEARRSLQPSRWGMDWTMPVVYRGSARKDERAWHIRAMDRVETVIFAPRQRQAIRSLMIALCVLLLAGSMLRLFWPSDMPLNTGMLQFASVLWSAIGMLAPLLVGVLLWPERRHIQNDKEQKVVWWAHVSGSMLGYVLGGFTLALVAPLLYLIGEWIPALVWWLILGGITCWSLVFSLVVARSQAHGAQANFRLYPETYGRSSWLIVVAGMVIVSVLLPTIIIPQVARTLVEIAGPSGPGIAVAVIVLIMIRSLHAD